MPQRLGVSAVTHAPFIEQHPVGHSVASQPPLPPPVVPDPPPVVVPPPVPVPPPVVPLPPPVPLFESTHWPAVHTCAVVHV